MTESRQQRRARERAERKAANGPGPNLRAVPNPQASEVKARRPALVEVQVEWVDDFWSARWEEVEDVFESPDDEDAEILEVSISDSDEDLGRLVGGIIESIAEQWQGCEVSIDWQLDDDAEQEVDKLGIELPGSA
ncbi:hypothetical protein ACFYV7_25435 [Nocardia suismassiliense]|uniref:DUF440 family protein n=1 Tax=Nocardia suismassiliense TaxID=2077092 RepID=A0ABW6QZ91_9NOCA